MGDDPLQVLGATVDGKYELTDFVEQRLFRPLAITSFEWPRNGVGQAHMGGGLRLSTRSLAKIADDKAQVQANHVRRVIFEEFPPSRHEKLRARYLPQDVADKRPFSF